MSFRPKPNDNLNISDRIYRIAEHPAAPGIAYGQSGRRGTVYQLVDEAGDAWALKVFQRQYREPRLAGQAERISTFASLPGLRVCDRKVLTSTQNVELIRDHMELAYAVLMPWIPGRTWMEMILGKEVVTANQSLRCAQTLLQMLTQMEERGIAHCDLSGSNIMIMPEEKIELVDLEEMFAPGLILPKALPGGSPGYAHRTAPEGLWDENADRFSGAILLAEILAWCEERVRARSWGEGYFDPGEMQTNCERFHLLKEVLEDLWGDMIPELFAVAWFSDTLSLCPTFTEWMAALSKAWSEKSLPATVEEDTSKEEAHRSISSETTIRTDMPDTEIQTKRVKTWICSVCEREVAFDVIVCPFCEKGVRPSHLTQVEDLPMEEGIQETATQDLESAEPASPKVTFSNGMLTVHWGDMRVQFQGWILGLIIVVVLVLALAFGTAGEPMANSTTEPAALYEATTSEETEVVMGEVTVEAGSVATQAVQTVMAEITQEAKENSKIEPVVEMNESSTIVATVASTATSPPHPGQVRENEADGAELVYVPEGEFPMGSDYAYDSYIWGNEIPAHIVYVDGYWIYRREVTNAMYRACVSAGGCERTSEPGMYLGINYYTNTEYSNYPVVQVDWYQAQEYCEWAGGRLPTEAEWEKAARGEDSRLFPWGNEEPNVYLVNLCDQLCPHEELKEDWNDSYPLSSPVGSFPRGDSPYGALDMAGNVWEWVADWYQKDYYSQSPSRNPSGPSSGVEKVTRGGSWYNTTDGIRAVTRLGIEPHDLRESVGFRCTVDAP